MSYNLNDYFQLGLDSTTTPQNSLVMNTIRTPVDTQSGRSGLSKVSFKVPKNGLLTGDSMITLQFIKNGAVGIGSSNTTPNFITGALGCIERARIIIDNKVLTDLERPSLLEVPKIYSRNTQNEVSQFNYKFLANQFSSKCDDVSGEEQFDTVNTRYFSDAGGTTDTQNVVRHIVSDEDNSHKYGIHLKHLGAEFLENQSLPVFLLGSREMVIELYIYKDCREYLVPTQGTLGASDFIVNYPIVELVSTHVQIPDEIAQNEVANLKSNPLSYPLIDNYLVKGTITNGAIGATTNKTFRINAQNREVHKILMCLTETSANIDSSQRVVANQKSIASGDIQLQIKSNGLNLYERPITSQALIYQQTTYAHNGMALKLPYFSFNVNARQGEIPQSSQTLFEQYRGTQHYLAIDFENGNGGVFGGGSVQKQAIEIEYQTKPQINADPHQENRQWDANFYISVSKMLTIGSNSVDISF